MNKLVLIMAALALLLAGCSDDSKVGSDALTNFDPNNPEGPRLGETTTTVPPETTAPPADAPQATTTTAKPAAATTAPPSAPAFDIQIKSDTAGGSQFEPRVAQVFAGTPVKWTNTDSVARSVEFADQSYLSGPIAPGASATFTPKRGGEFNYSDGTRPYAQGTLRVQAR